MATETISIRMSAKELIDVYNFLSIICKYNTGNLPVSKAMQIALCQLIKWARTIEELPTYDTDEDAIIALSKYLDKLPTAFAKKVIAQEVTPHIKAPHDMPIIVEKENEIVSGQNLSDNSEQPQSSKEEIEKKRQKLISMIDQFTDRTEEQEAEELLDVVKTNSIYK